MRSRSSLLEAILTLKRVNARISVNEIIAFLYACENEGLSVQEMAFVAELTQSTASRSLRALGRPGTPWAQPPAMDLVEAFLNPDDARSHVIHLTDNGRHLRDRLDAIMRSGILIAEAVE